MTIRLAVFSSTRADSGILRPLIEELDKRNECSLQVYLSGTHFKTDSEYEPDPDFSQLDINNIVLVPILGLYSKGLERSLGDAYTIYLQQLNQDKPDAAIVLGDRIETLMFVFACTIANVPVIHLHGGELTFGALDELHRHAITKMSALHFCVDDHSAKRIRQMGESPDKVFPFGSPRWESLDSPGLMSLIEIQAAINKEIPEDFALVTVHPAKYDNPDTLVHLNALLEALTQTNIFTIFTGPNADQGSEELRIRIIKFVNEHPNQSLFVENLGARVYASALRLCRVVIGNSSSLVLEAPRFGTPAIFIGQRQAGRSSTSEGLAANVSEISHKIRSILTSPRPAHHEIQSANVSSRMADQIMKSFPLITRRQFYEI